MLTTPSSPPNCGSQPPPIQWTAARSHPLITSAGSAPHHTLNANVMSVNVINVSSPLYMFFPNAQVLGQEQVISDVIRTSVLASESESGDGKAADELRAQHHV